LFGRSPTQPLSDDEMTKITLRLIPALLLFACTPAPQQQQPAPDSAPSQQAAPEAQAPQNPYTAALSAPLPDGQWFSEETSSRTSAGFGLPESEFQFVVSCATRAGKLSVTLERELAPDQQTTMRIVTAPQMLDLPARSFNEGLPHVLAELAPDAPEEGPLVRMLGAPQDRFAVEVAGEFQVFPWDESLARALTACAER